MNILALEPKLDNKIVELKENRISLRSLFATGLKGCRKCYLFRCKKDKCYYNNLKKSAIIQSNDVLKGLEDYDLYNRRRSRGII